jgi:hypothetical protein
MDGPSDGRAERTFSLCLSPGLMGCQATKRSLSGSLPRGRDAAECTLDRCPCHGPPSLGPPPRPFPCLPASPRGPVLPRTTRSTRGWCSGGCQLLPCGGICPQSSFMEIKVTLSEDAFGCIELFDPPCQYAAV